MKVYIVYSSTREILRGISNSKRMVETINSMNKVFTDKKAADFYAKQQNLNMKSKQQPNTPIYHVYELDLVTDDFTKFALGGNDD